MQGKKGRLWQSWGAWSLCPPKSAYESALAKALMSADCSRVLFLAVNKNCDSSLNKKSF